MNKILVLDPAKDREFIANGKHYTISNTLTIRRMREYQKLELEVAYSGFYAFMKQTKKLTEHLNKIEFVDAAVIAHNINTSCKNIHDQRDAVLLMCCLFINEDSEDVRNITEGQCKAKIHDWEEAGINYDFFLRLVAALIPGFTDAYKAAFRSTLNLKEVKDGISTLLSNRSE